MVFLISPLMIKKTSILLFLTTFAVLVNAQIIQRDFNPKLSISTIQKLEEKATKGNADKYINLYLHFAEDTDIDSISEKYGIKLNVGYSNIYTAIVPMASVEEMSKDEHITYIDAGNDVREMMDSVRYYTNIDNIYYGNDGIGRPYKGEGVIVGIIDAGFDFLHPNFRDSDGNCRIKTVWDQNFFAGTNSPYGYGKEYTSTEEIINAKRDAEFSKDTHGTHVAGIATDSYNSQYRGIAPEAEIALVSTNKTEQGIVDAVDFLIGYSEKAGKPIAINLSIGTVLGYKDGTDNFSILIDNLLKDQKGKILAIAAGNEGDRNSTIFGYFGNDHKQIKTIWNLPEYGRDNLFIQSEKGCNYEFTVMLKDTVTDKTFFEETFSTQNPVGKTFENIGSPSNETGKLTVTVSSNPTNNNPVIRMSLSYTKTKDEVLIISMNSENGKYMINSDYGEFIAGTEDGCVNGTNEYTIACTATGFNTISVGAYVSKHTHKDLSENEYKSEWIKEDLYPLSGKGPTFDGRIKPDVTAPGAKVVSSLSSYASSFFVNPEMKVFQIDDDLYNRKYTWGVLSGTSMATPVVTGTLALWMEAIPDMTVEQAREIIKTTSIKDSYTGDNDNGKFGYGKLDAEAGLKYILQSVGTDNISSKSFNYFYDKQTGYISFDTDYTIAGINFYSISGELVSSIKNLGNSFQICLPKGNIYIANIITNERSFNIKIAL